MAEGTNDSSRQRLVVGAADMIRRRGLNATSVRHLADHHSGGDVDAFTRALVLSPDTGIANTESRTGHVGYGGA